MSDVAARPGGKDRKSSGAQFGSEQPSRSFFEIYKAGQGTHTRTWSGIGAGALVVWFAAFLYERFSVVEGEYTQVWQVGAAVLVVVVFGLLGYYLLGRNRKVCDFLIATEGEMKKVNWTNRKEIIGSTKVVVFVLVGMSVLLFVVDVFFMALFSWLGVLEGKGFVDAVKSVFSS